MAEGNQILPVFSYVEGDHRLLCNLLQLYVGQMLQWWYHAIHADNRVLQVQCKSSQQSYIFGLCWTAAAGTSLQTHCLCTDNLVDRACAPPIDNSIQHLMHVVVMCGAEGNLACTLALQT